MSTDFSKFISGTAWEDGNQSWLKYEEEILNAPSMEDRPLSGKSLLKYLAIKEVTVELQTELEKYGFSFYKIFTSSHVTQAQKEKLHESKKFMQYIGKFLS